MASDDSLEHSVCELKLQTFSRNEISHTGMAPKDLSAAPSTVHSLLSFHTGWDYSFRDVSSSVAFTACTEKYQPSDTEWSPRFFSKQDQTAGMALVQFSREMAGLHLSAFGIWDASLVMVWSTLDALDFVLTFNVS